MKSNKLTKLGKLISHLPIDHNITRPIMTQDMGVDSAMVHAMLYGTKNISENMVNKLIDYFGKLDKSSDLSIRITDAAYYSRTHYTISVEGIEHSRREVVAMMARIYHDLTYDQMAAIKEILATSDINKETQYA